MTAGAYGIAVHVPLPVEAVGKALIPVLSATLRHQGFVTRRFQKLKSSERAILENVKFNIERSLITREGGKVRVTEYALHLDLEPAVIRHESKFVCIERYRVITKDFFLACLYAQVRQYPSGLERGADRPNAVAAACSYRFPCPPTPPSGIPDRGSILGSFTCSSLPNFFGRGTESGRRFRSGRSGRATGGAGCCAIIGSFLSVC